MVGTQIFKYSKISFAKERKTYDCDPTTHQVSGNCTPDEIAKYLHLHKLQVSLTTYVEADLIDIDGILMVGRDDIKLQPDLILKTKKTSLYSSPYFILHLLLLILNYVIDYIYHKYKSFLSLW